MSFAATSRSPFTRAGVLLAFGLAACQPAAPPGEPADLLIVNGRVFAADAAGTTAEAVAVRGQTIARVGTTAELSALRGPATRVIDARGGSVLPGFNDAHVHILSGGFSLSHLDLGGLTTLRQVQAAISAFAADHPGTGWLRGRGWLYTPFPGGSRRGSSSTRWCATVPS